MMMLVVIGMEPIKGSRRSVRMEAMKSLLYVKHRFFGSTEVHSVSYQVDAILLLLGIMKDPTVRKNLLLHEQDLVLSYDGQTRYGTPLSHPTSTIHSTIIPLFEIIITMKIAVVFVTLIASTQAFSPVAFTRGVTVTKSQIFAEPVEQQEDDGLDLNLEEMFDM